MKRPTGIVMSVVIALIVGGMLVWFVVGQSGKSNTKVSFGREQFFPAGSIGPMAERITKDGPVLYATPTRGGADVFVQHSGSDEASGWHVFDAQAPGQGRQCTLQWRAVEHRFLDPCSQQIYPDDGGSLRHYRVVLDDGQVKIDFRTLVP